MNELKERVCPKCSGFGEFLLEQNEHNWINGHTPCDRCNGFGFLIREPVLKSNGVIGHELKRFLTAWRRIPM